MDYLLRIDRRVIFLLLFVAVTLAVLFGDPSKIPIVTTPAVRGVWEPIEKLKPGDPVLVAIDYDPASGAELDPMAKASLRQVFRKGVRMISMTHWPTGVQMASDLVAEMAMEFDDVTLETVKTFEAKVEAEKFLAEEIAKPGSGAGLSTGTRVTVNVGRKTGPASLPWTVDLLAAVRGAKPGLVEKPVSSDGGKTWAALRVIARAPTLEYGKDYCFLGTKGGEQVLVLTMGQSIPTAFPTDPHTGRSTRDLPVMQGVESLKDIAYLLELGAGSSVDWWVKYGSQRYGFKMGVGCTAVMAPDEYPYYGAGMITGLCGGIKGAWEYEKLVETPGTAMKAIPAQTVAHLLVIALIVFCNIAYFWTRMRGVRP